MNAPKLSAEKIVGMTLLALPDDRIPTEEQIRETVDRLATAFGVDASMRALILQKVFARGLIS